MAAEQANRSLLDELMRMQQDTKVSQDGGPSEAGEVPTDQGRRTVVHP